MEDRCRPLERSLLLQNPNPPSQTDSFPLTNHLNEFFLHFFVLQEEYDSEGDGGGIFTLNRSLSDMPVREFTGLTRRKHLYETSCRLGAVKFSLDGDYLFCELGNSNGFWENRDAYVLSEPSDIDPKNIVCTIDFSRSKLDRTLQNESGTEGSLNNESDDEINFLVGISHISFYIDDTKLSSWFANFGTTISNPYRESARRCAQASLNRRSRKVETRVREEMIRPVGSAGDPFFEKPREGDKVEVRYRGREKWCIGKVMRENADGTFEIQYEDNEKSQVSGQYSCIFDISIRVQSLEAILYLPADLRERSGHDAVTCSIEQLAYTLSPRTRGHMLGSKGLGADERDTPSAELSPRSLWPCVSFIVPGIIKSLREKGEYSGVFEVQDWQPEPVTT